MEAAPFVPAEYATLFFDLFEHSSDVIFLTRVNDGLVLDANHAALSMFGYRRDEAVGKTTRDLRIWADPRDRVEFVEAMRSEGG
jgi:two-component system NtrC family sensor kinase